MDEVESAFDSAENAILQCYRTKGLRSFHQHLILHIRNSLYFIGFIVTVLFMVNEQDTYGYGLRHPFFVLSPLIIASMFECATVILNCFYLCFRAANDRHIEMVRQEPTFLEILILHSIPLVTAALGFTMLFVIPYCYLSEHRPEGKEKLCKVFKPVVMRAIAILFLSVYAVHFVYDVSTHKRTTSVIKRKKVKETSFIPLLGEDDTDNDRSENELFNQLETRRAYRGRKVDFDLSKDEEF